MKYFVEITVTILKAVAFGSVIEYGWPVSSSQYPWYACWRAVFTRMMSINARIYQGNCHHAFRMSLKLCVITAPD